MSRIKIICDPYKKMNLFQVYNVMEDKWVDVNIDNNPNSKLLSDVFHKGFFPFKVSDIVKEIANEYGIDGESIELYFRGTDDDFNELKQVCASMKNQCQIILKKEELQLNNANTVLSEIIKVFKNLRPIIAQSENNRVEVEKNLDKFSDVTNEVIPLCIMGNYSAGKSTFINALIGNEILPSGDEPVTAKVFKINQAEHEGVASIKLQKGTGEIMLMFYEQGYEFIGAETLDPLVEQVSSVLNDMQEESITKRINKTLSIINQFDSKETSDLIEISIPFCGGLWEETETKFVILDTPGSNSATNTEHSEVLEKALSGLTNGLTIYVSEYDNLDSMDNKKLYDKIKSMDELDSRFTLIVVNKADENDLPEEGYYSEEKADDVLNLTVPKNLYTEGIFFVSSILGLGSKTNGSFISKHLNKIYRKTKFIFADEEDEDYTMLYRYNIMPEQLKEKAIERAENSSEDLVYVNSGLFSVEQEIKNFADRYASYNKCEQSTMYLDNIINIISKEIQEIIIKREKIRQDLKDALEKDKMDLIEKIQVSSDFFNKQFVNEYMDYMKEYIEKVKPSFEQDEIKNLEIQFTKEQKELLNFEDKEEDVKESIDSLKFNFKESVDGIFKKRNIGALKELGKTFVEDVKDTFDNLGERHLTKREADKATAKILLDKVNSDYKILSSESQTKIDVTSKSYWSNKAEVMKKELSEIITGSTALSDDKRTEIAGIIMTYQTIEFEQYKNTSFELEDFVHGIKLGDIVLYESDKLNIRKVVNSYNKLFDLFTKEVRNLLHKSHCKTFDYWLESLLSIIVKNIVNYSPILSDKQKDIDEETAKIYDLEKRQEKIRDGITYIKNMMDWHTN